MGNKRIIMGYYEDGEFIEVRPKKKKTQDFPLSTTRKLVRAPKEKRKVSTKQLENLKKGRQILAEKSTSQTSVTENSSVLPKIRKFK